MLTGMFKASVSALGATLMGAIMSGDPPAAYAKTPRSVRCPRAGAPAALVRGVRAVRSRKSAAGPRHRRRSRAGARQERPHGLLANLCLQPASGFELKLVRTDADLLIEGCDTGS